MGTKISVSVEGDFKVHVKQGTKSTWVTGCHSDGPRTVEFEFDPEVEGPFIIDPEVEDDPREYGL